ncbi:MAG TPA: Hpt domain-containing protein, partial [Paenirhodobacter sp.]
MPNDPLAEIRAGFFAECEELMESLRDSIDALNVDAPDPQLINTIFRAVHSIKGGAGAFGFERLVDFSHRYEGVLDGLRAGQVRVNESMLLLLAQACDALEDHMQAARDATPPPTEGDSVLAELQMQLGQLPDEADCADFCYLPMRMDLSALQDDEPQGWHVTFTPQGGLYVSGNEPFYLLRT